jgi:Family of unknown function (DUF5706)
MEPDKGSFLTAFFDQIESQVQFGDAKASLLIAGNAILLGISGGLAKLLAGCPGDEISFRCMTVSAELVVALLSSALFILALVFSLVAARPARIHSKPTAEFFLLSHVARLKRAEFVEKYKTASHAELTDDALRTIHAKACFATAKFRRLRYAVDCTLTGLALMAAAMLVAIAGQWLR